MAQPAIGRKWYFFRCLVIWYYFALPFSQILCPVLISTGQSKNLTEYQSCSKAWCSVTFPWLVFLYGCQSKWSTIADFGHKFKFYTLWQLDELTILKSRLFCLCLIWDVFTLCTSSFVHSDAISLSNVIKCFLLSRATNSKWVQFGLFEKNILINTL